MLPPNCTNLRNSSNLIRHAKAFPTAKYDLLFNVFCVQTTGLALHVLTEERYEHNRNSVYILFVSFPILFI